MIGTPPPNPLGSHLGLGRSSSGGGDTKKQLVNEGGPDTPKGGNPPSLYWIPRSLVPSSCRYGWWEGMGEENGRREIGVAGKEEEGHTHQIYIQNWCGDTPHTHFPGNPGVQTPDLPPPTYPEVLLSILYQNLAVQEDPKPSFHSATQELCTQPLLLGDTGIQTPSTSPFYNPGLNI